MGKQYWQLGDIGTSGGYAELFGSKNEQNLQIVEAIMLLLSQDKRTLFAELKNLYSTS